MSNPTNSSAKADELQRRLPRHAAQMEFAIATALATLRLTRRATNVTNDLTRGYVKGLSDALSVMRLADEAAGRFRDWCQAVTSEPGLCVLSDAERSELTAPPISADKALELLAGISDEQGKYSARTNDELRSELIELISTGHSIGSREALFNEIARRLHGDSRNHVGDVQPSSPAQETR